MGVYLRTERGRAPRLYIRYIVGGIRHREALPVGATEREARDLLETRRVEARKGILHRKMGLAETVGQIVDRWIEHVCALGRRSATTYPYRRAHLAAAPIWHVLAPVLTVRDVDGYTRGRLGEKRRPSNGTLNRELAVLRGSLRWAQRRGELVSVPLIEDLREAAGRLRYLSRDEEVRLLDECRPALRRLCVVAVETGCRLGELTARTWGDVDAGAGILHIEQSKGGTRRDLPLNRRALDALGPAGEARANVFPPCLTRVRRRGDPPRTARAGPWRGASVQFRGAARRACLKDVCFHTLRHTFASRLAIGGTPLVIIRDLLGHASIKTTERYAHLCPGALRTAVDSLGGGPNGGR